MIDSLVRARLEALGYDLPEDEGPAVDMAVLRAECRLKALTNQREVPAGLLYVWADMAAGDHLAERKAVGGLEGYDFSEAVKSVSEGDTSVTYTGVASPEARFEALLARLWDPSEHILAAYRRIRW